mgnify:CR=1 FL=1
MIERLLLGASGGALTVYGIRRNSLVGALLAVAGSGLVLRSFLGGKTVGLPDELHIERSVLIAKPPVDVYRAWRDVARLPLLLRHVVEVREIDARRSHWKARVMAKAAIVEWDAEIVDDVEGERVAWRSIGGPVAMNGEVRFEHALPIDGTVLHVDLRYRANRGGVVGKAAAAIFNRAGVEEVKEDLRRFKAELEAGEIPSTRGQPHGAGYERAPNTRLDRVGGGER